MSNNDKNKNNTSDALWRAFDLLRGSLPFEATLDVLLNVFYLKLIDERLPEDSPIFAGQASRFRWSNWVELPEAELPGQLKNSVVPYMASLDREAPEIASFFRDAKIPVVADTFIYQIIQTINKVELSTLSNKQRSRLMNRITHRLSGKVFEPSSILRKLIIDVLDPEASESICDLNCGLGSLLVKIALNRSKEAEEIEPGVIEGFDRSRSNIRVAQFHAALFGLELNVTHKDISEETLNSGPFDVVLASPPFGQVTSGQQMSLFEKSDKKYGEFAYISAALKAVKPGGRGAVLITPNIFYSHTKVQIAIQERLVKEARILAIVALPAPILQPFISLDTSLIVFEKPDLENEEIPSQHVWYYSLSNEFDKLRAYCRESSSQELEFLTCWNNYRASQFTAPPGPQSTETLPAHSEEPSCWWAEISEIKAKDYWLLPNLYRPNVALAPLPNPLELLNRALTLEKEMLKTLTTLRNDLAHRQFHGTKTRLGDICVPKPGRTPPRSRPEYWEGEIPVARLVDAPNDELLHVIENTEKHVSKEAVKQLRLTLLPKNTVLISTTGNIGKVAMTGREMIASSSWLPLLTKTEIRPQFLAYCLLSIQREIVSLGKGTTISRLSWQDLQNLEIIVPSESEQDQMLDRLEQLKSLFEQQSSFSSLSRQIFQSYLSSALSSVQREDSE